MYAFWDNAEKIFCKIINANKFNIYDTCLVYFGGINSSCEFTAGETGDSTIWKPLRENNSLISHPVLLFHQLPLPCESDPIWKPTPASVWYLWEGLVWCKWKSFQVLRRCLSILVPLRVATSPSFPLPTVHIRPSKLASVSRRWLTSQKSSCRECAL